MCASKCSQHNSHQATSLDPLNSTTKDKTRPIHTTHQAPPSTKLFLNPVMSSRISLQPYSNSFPGPRTPCDRNIMWDNPCKIHVSHKHLCPSFAKTPITGLGMVMCVTFIGTSVRSVTFILCFKKKNRQSGDDIYIYVPFHSIEYFLNEGI